MKFVPNAQIWFIKRVVKAFSKVFVLIDMIVFEAIIFEVNLFEDKIFEVILFEVISIVCLVP